MVREYLKAPLLLHEVAPANAAQNRCTWTSARVSCAVRLIGMDYIRDPRVDAYITSLPEWQQTVCQHVRDLVHAADSDVSETIKRTVQPYFVLDGNICALLATKDHVNVFLYDGGIVPDPDGIITGGRENQTARTISSARASRAEGRGPGRSSKKQTFRGIWNNDLAQHPMSNDARIS